MNATTFIIGAVCALFVVLYSIRREARLSRDDWD
jgi:hypothetical protein